MYPSLSLSIQGNDEEAVVDQGKTSSTIHTNFEKEELESKPLPSKWHIYFGMNGNKAVSSG
uniref:Uncharacterized protein n=1 Tax=Sinocyclocheilus anshuiensis TaxID=1608454 RepID=A0A671K6C0_9TELE